MQRREIDLQYFEWSNRNSQGLRRSKKFKALLQLFFKVLQLVTPFIALLPARFVKTWLVCMSE